jgi:RNA polymerase sigma-70 factor, ECF subfamily
VSGDQRNVVPRKALAHPPATEPQPLEFNDFYATHFGFVWRCLRALGVPSRQLDDAAQEVFLGVHRGLHSFRGDAAPRTWLYGIVRNVAYKQYRTEHRRGASPLDDEPVASSATPAEQAQDAEAAVFVRRFVAGLDSKKRDVFVLALLEELSIPEVAQIVEAPLNTVYTRLRNVRIEFREALLRHGGTP